MSKIKDLAIDGEQKQNIEDAKFNAYEDIQECFENVIEYDDDITENLNGTF